MESGALFVAAALATSRLTLLAGSWDIRHQLATVLNRMYNSVYLQWQMVQIMSYQSVCAQFNLLGLTYEATQLFYLMYTPGVHASCVCLQREHALPQKP